MKKRLLLLVSLIAVLALAACGQNVEEPAANRNAPAGNGNEAAAEATTLEEDNKIVLGVSPVPHEEIIEALEDQFVEKGLELEVVVFDDYVMPNKALAEGDLDANFFQHEPYLNDFAESNNLDLTNIGGVHIEPMGFYSTKYNSIEEIPDGAEILIPNDDTNGGRALILLEENGLIKLEDNTNLSSTEQDIAENPKNITFTPVDAANIARAYVDVDGGVINSNFAIGAGLNPTEDSIVMESKDAIYKNIVAVRTGEENKEKFKVLMEVLNSEECKAYLEETYGGSIVPAF